VRDLSFVPNQKAICLDFKQDEEEERVQRLLSRVEAATTGMQRTHNQVLDNFTDTVSKHHSEVKEKLGELCEVEKKETGQILSDLEKKVQGIESSLFGYQRKIDNVFALLTKVSHKLDKTSRKTNKKDEDDDDDDNAERKLNKGRAKSMTKLERKHEAKDMSNLLRTRSPLRQAQRGRKGSLMDSGSETTTNEDLTSSEASSPEMLGEDDI
jgi:hypothetical protein